MRKLGFTGKNIFLLVRNMFLLLEKIAYTEKKIVFRLTGIKFSLLGMIIIKEKLFVSTSVKYTST